MKPMNRETAIEYQWTLRDIENEQNDIPYAVKEAKKDGFSYEDTMMCLCDDLWADLDERLENDYLKELVGCLHIDMHEIAERLMADYWN